jgi:predicted flap endonuclease-1-like 5' DNA nuclease
MSQTTIIIIIAVIVVIALLAFFLLRGRKQHVSFGEAPAPQMAPLQKAAAQPAPIKPAAPTPVPVEEGHGVDSEISAAIEDVVDQFIGINAHPSGQPTSTGAGDTLTTLKGLGPKAESRLHDLGVTRFDQIAAWTTQDVEAVDAQMGAFKGRIVRDKWVEQARLLAKGDTAAFEEQFGKLG